MKEIFQRFMILFHWVGFLSLVGFVLLIPLAMIQDGLSLTEVMLIVVDDVLPFEEEGWSAMLWLGITHYPIKWILTGNKSPFPWKS